MQEVLSLSPTRSAFPFWLGRLPEQITIADICRDELVECSVTRFRGVGLDL